MDVLSSFNRIARTAGNAQVIFCVRSTFFKWNHMVKRQVHAFRFPSADVAGSVIALNHLLSVDSFYDRTIAQARTSAPACFPVCFGIFLFVCALLASVVIVALQSLLLFTQLVTLIAFSFLTPFTRGANGIAIKNTLLRFQPEAFNISFLVAVVTAFQHSLIITLLVVN